MKLKRESLAIFIVCLVGSLAHVLLLSQRVNIKGNSMPPLARVEINRTTLSGEINRTNSEREKNWKLWKVYTFNNVCIEDVPKDDAIHRKYGAKKQIVVYTSNSTWHDGELYVASAHNVKTREWDMVYRTELMPESRKLLDNTALFVMPTCPGNLHHFWADEFIFLASQVRHLNQSDGAPYHIYYRKPHRQMKKDCHDVDRYEVILSSVNMEFHKWFGDAPPGVCYKKAIFGRDRLRYPAHTAPDFVLNSLKMNFSDCPQKTVTILTRRYRRILNLGELEAALVERNYTVKVVDFAAMSGMDQLRTAMCTSVLIGVQGAGLQWLVFMEKGSLVVEVAWPKHHWRHHYRPRAKMYKQKHAGIVAEEVFPNWEEYEKTIRKGVKVKYEEKKKLLKSSPKSYGSDNIWKYADATVDPLHILNKL